MPTTTKKSASRSTTTAKAKKPVAHKKSAVKHAKKAELRSFRLYRESKPFLSASPSIQSFYWMVIGVLVLVLVGWVMYLTVQIQGIYDNISTTDSTTPTVIHKK
jgi:hypothetical protein